MSISCFLGLSMMDYYEEEATITKQEKLTVQLAFMPYLYMIWDYFAKH